MVSSNVSFRAWSTTVLGRDVTHPAAKIVQDQVDQHLVTMMSTFGVDSVQLQDRRLTEPLSQAGR